MSRLWLLCDLNRKVRRVPQLRSLNICTSGIQHEKVVCCECDMRASGIDQGPTSLFKNLRTMYTINIGLHSGYVNDKF